MNGLSQQSKAKNSVFIATSLDGYIADSQGGLDWLQSVPNPEGLDMGYRKFMDRVDALVMGRNTFETVCGFGGEWPYEKPVFVLSSSIRDVPDELLGKVECLHPTVISGGEGDSVRAQPEDVVSHLQSRGYFRLYLDGGALIQSFLSSGLVHEMIVTQMPVLLGGGTRLFGQLSDPLQFTLVASEVFLGQVVQSHYLLKS